MPLQFRNSSANSKNIKLKWKAVKGARKYVIYGNKCGKSNKMKKLATVKGSKYTVKKVNGKKLAKGKYYKFVLIAVGDRDKVISTSKTIHVAAAKKKAGNHKAVKVKKAVVKKAAKLKKGKSLKLNAKQVVASKKLKIRKHVNVRYESSNVKIATVTKKGVVKGKKKGSCYVYAYAQNGVAKKIKVTVR